MTITPYYFPSVTSNVLTRTLRTTPDSATSSAFAPTTNVPANPPITEGSVTRIEFLITPSPGTILHTSVRPSTLSLVFSKSKEFMITPFIRLRDNDPATSDKLLWSGLPKNTVENSVENRTKMIWNDVRINIPSDRETKTIVLTLEIRNMPLATGADNLNGGATFSESQTFLELDMRPGAPFGGLMNSEVFFKLHQIRVNKTIRSQINVYEGVNVPIRTFVSLQKNVFGSIYSDVGIKVEEFGDINSSVQWINNNSLSNPFTNVTIGDRVLLKGGELRRKTTLDNVVNDLANPPKVYHPPKVPSLPEIDADLYGQLAQQVMAVVEDFRLFDNIDAAGGVTLRTKAPGGLMYAFSPAGEITGDAIGEKIVLVRGSDEWTLPAGYYNKEYQMSFAGDPKILDHRNLPVKPKRVTSLLFFMRQRDLGNFSRAFIGGGAGEGKAEEGTIIYDKHVSSTDKAQVWFWQNPKDFTVHFLTRNPLQVQKGFVGQGAGMVICI